MKKVVINDITYEVVKNVKEALDVELLKEKITDYYDNYDYIVGDWAYGKVRLKGFYDSSNKKCKEYNNILYLERYLEERCAYDCRWFEIKKIND